MRFHFVIEGLTPEQADTLLSIESAMNGRSATAVFNLKNLDIYTHRDSERIIEFVSSKLGKFLMDSLEGLLGSTGLNLISLYHAVKGVPVVLTARRI